MNDLYTPVDPLTLQMLAIMALDELKIAATHRRIDTGVPVFLGLVRTEAFWQQTHPLLTIRRATTAFRLGDMIHLFDQPIYYPLLGRFEVQLSAAIWMLVNDLHIVDGSSFVDLPYTGLMAPVYTAHDTDVAVLMNIDRERGQFRLTAAVV